MTLKPYIVRDMLEDADAFGYIQKGALADCYDQQANYINERLSNDLSVDQIAKIIWNAFFHELCVYDDVKLSKKEAIAIIGDPSRFEVLAKLIRKQLKY